MSDPAFFAELQRRRVLPIAGAYIAIAWLVTEILSFLLEQIGAPAWTVRLLAIIFVVGFPIAAVLAWTIQVGPDGKRSLDPSAGQGKTVIAAVILGVFATAGLAWLILPRIDDAANVSAYQPLPNSLAVLPLTTTSGTPNEQTIAETLHTVLLDGLDQSRELTQVRLRLDQAPADPAAFGREYRIAALLLGHVARVAGSTKIELQLLDVGESKVRWSDTIEWDPTRIMEVGTQISDAVLENLGLSEIPQTQFVGTDSREAYEAYLLGTKHLAVYNAKNVAIAVGYLERAVTLDPGYVRGHALLASAYNVNSRFASTSREEWQEWTAKARKSAEMAIELDPNSADAISVLARLEQNPELQAQLLERALELDPDHGASLHRYALLILRPSGQLQEAAEMLERVLHKDPLDANNRSELGFTLWEMGHEEEGIAQVEKSIELQPDMMQNYHWLGYRMWFHYGRLDDAIILHRKAYAVNPETGFHAAPVASHYAGLGMRKEALAFLEKGVEVLGWNLAINFMAGLTYERLGDRDKSLDYYMRFVEGARNSQYEDHEEIPEILLRNDLREGRYEDAIERFKSTYGEGGSDDAAADHDRLAIHEYDYLYGRLLKAAGKTEEARQRFERVARQAEAGCIEDDSKFGCRLLWQVFAHLGDRRKTLDWLHYSIVEKRYFANNQYFADESLDFLRDDPEFRDLMAYVDNEMDRQRSRIRAMECAGEMPPAPDIDLSGFCS